MICFSKRRMNIYIFQLSLLSPWDLEMMSSMGKVIVVASMYPASRIVITPISCEYTSILDNILLLRAMGYDFYIIQVCFIQMQCNVLLKH